MDHKIKDPTSNIQNSKKVMVVDDDPISRKLTSRIFKEAGCEVMTARDGIEALGILKTSAPHIITIDLLMPYLRGDRLCQIIREMEQFKAVCLVLISAVAAEAAPDLSAFGANASVVKGAPDFAQCLLELLDRADQSVAPKTSKEIICQDKLIQRTATKELLAEQQRLETIVQTMVEPLFELTSDGRIIFANQKAVALAGMPEYKLLGSDFLDLFSMAHVERIRDLLETAKDASAEIDEDAPVLINGRQVSGRLVPMAVDARQTVIAMLYDITVCSQAKQDLECRLACFKDIVEKHADGILVVNEQGKGVHYANPTAGTLLQQPVEQMIGQKFGLPIIKDRFVEIDIFHPDTGKSGTAEMRMVESDWKNRPAHLITLTDITRRKQLEQGLKEANAQLKAVNRKILEQQESMIEEERLKVLLQMAGASAHELNQPLLSLLGNIELIRMIKDDSAQINQWLDNIETAGRRIADIVKKMQTIRRGDVKALAGDTSILNLNQEINLLIVEDSDIDFEMLHSLVKDQQQIRLARAKSISEGLRLAQQSGMDIIILDYLLPDGNGLDFLKKMEALGIEKPVLAVTGRGDEMIASCMVKSGAYDYLPKSGTNQSVLLRSIKTALEQSRLKKEVAKATQKLAQMATRDGLTGLHNRRQLNDMLAYEFKRATRFGTDLSCLLLDLDYFKEINDSFGHGFGDFVLQQFATRLADNVRESDACFRYGGEEFMVLLPQTDIQEAKQTAEKIRRLCDAEPYSNGDYERIVTVSIGVSSLNHRAAVKPEDLLSHADRALYQAKAEGRNRVNVYLEAFPSEAGSNGGNTIDVTYLKDRLAALLEKTKKTSVETLELLVRGAGSSRFKDHNQRVVQYLGLAGAKLGMPIAIIQTLQRAATLHDCTKVLLPPIVLDKKDHLDEVEMEKIKDHTFIVAELIEPFDFFADERTVLLSHHENYNGTGYPDGLQGAQIPIGSRLFAIADALVAMTSERPHRPNLSAEQVVQELVGNAGTQFDPNLVGIFLEVISETSLLDVPEQTLTAAKETVAGIEN